MNVLSLFDGMSCGQIALNRAGIKYSNYYAAEIDKSAIEICQKNYPKTIQLGDIRHIKGDALPKIDLLIGGSPCTGFSKAGKGLNFEDPQSILFFEFVRLLRECNPDYFLLENVEMKKEWQAVISKYMGVEPILINSALVSAQNRKRLYWTNLERRNPIKDKKILLKDVLEGSTTGSRIAIKPPLKIRKVQNGWGAISTCLIVTEATKTGFVEVENGCCFDYTQPKSKNRRGRLMRHKSNTLTTSHSYMRYEHPFYRKLTPIECERLQTVPDNYTKGVSTAQRYKMLGNGWTVDVVSHILSHLEEKR
jgi:DNA (cytosine-5)-methyltransferase 3A